MLKTYQRNKEIERTIKFLVNSIDKPGNKSKPIILHSIRVGLYLDRQNYDKDIVIAAILHDLLEDSEITAHEIKNNFNNKIAKLVLANSYDKSTEDKKKRYYETLSRCLDIGKEALVIKAADILDNSHYYQLVKDEKLYQWLLEKLSHFINHTESILGDEKVWKELKRQHTKLTKNKI